ncbi:MBOAT family O-acyltransferase [Rheinheimera sp. MMS21-TC3]|uniref:MBOAT family O-acyltransferase n=1 Tax=Rheinheimera sp. MMS21-TC3 TaxID=3072790 RepID=UPI0028C4406F|nr:MBOAT family O-acyltransferase [Rheinheimera sp. MMS21-TC3]WNO60675.1 MBOAT family O-acyltransferase [Rheinheimera sp. MMS21-TC3]
MSFTSLHFYLFLLLLLGLLRFISNNKHKKLLLLVVSYWFYMSWDWRFGALLFAMTAVNFYCGKKIHRSIYAKRWLAVSIIFSLGLLGFFKYFNFFLDNLDVVAAWFGLSSHLGLLQILLPVGISFYTFQALSYTIDIYKKELEPVSSLADFALFVSFFPQLVAGPIVRASYFLPQLTKQSRVDSAAQQEAVMLIIKGLIKKVILADILAIHLVDPAFTNYGSLSSAFLILALVGYSFQVYLDFSAYTDIARGCALLLGYKLPINFNRPYLAHSISNFWQRWHISMSSFFRDYLYHGVGGSRYGNVYINLFITFIAIGFWHGAGWNFLLYGFCHGAVVSIERFGRQYGWFLLNTGWLHILAILRTFFIVCLLRVMFRAESLAEANQYMLAIWHNSHLPFDLTTVGAVALISAIILHLIPQRIMASWQQRFVSSSHLLQATSIVLVLFSLIIFGSAEAPFIYFQF